MGPEGNGASPQPYCLTGEPASRHILPPMNDLLERLQSAFGTTYRLEKELGGGGMSRVFVAVESALGRKVVIKVLPPELGAALSVDRFRREIQVAASLHHPHIVPLLAAGEADGLLYYTMPLIEGESLRVKLAREGELPIGEAVRILRDVADALALAHEHGVVHRDIKPDNVLISRNHALVTDFGVAKALSEASGAAALTSTGMALGTPAYMAPEQAAADAHVDHRADLYALGAMAYEILTGRPPFIGPTAQAVLAAQVTKTPEPLAEARTTVPPGLSALVMRCLEKRPADRWQSSEELLHQLEAMATPSGGTTPTAAVPVASTPPATRSAPSAATASPARSLRPAIFVGLLLVVLVVGYLLHGRGSRASIVRSEDVKKTLVVLPFENLGSSDDNYFADGLTEEITSRLAVVTGLRVTSRTTAMQYRGAQKTARQIGQELGVGYVLEGSVRWEKVGSGPSHFRVTPQLIQVSDDSHLWANRYDGVLAQVFEVQSRVAEQVVSALGVALLEPQRQALAAKPTDNLEAYDYYLRGNEYLTRGNSEGPIGLAIGMYRKAIGLDSTFALAWARLSRAEAQLYNIYGDRTPAWLMEVKRSAERALQLQPDLPEAHLAMAYYHYWGYDDYGPALEELTLVQKSQPDNPDLIDAIGRVHRRQGDWKTAITLIKQAAALDPRSNYWTYEAGQTLRLMREYPEAESFLDRATELAPDLRDAFLDRVALYLNWRGDVGRARAVLREADGRIGVGPVLLNNEGPSPLFLVAEDPAWLKEVEALTQAAFGSDTASFLLLRGDLLRLRGDATGARIYYDSLRVQLGRMILAVPDAPKFHSLLGLALARLGQKDEAIREGRRAVELLPISRDAVWGVYWAANLAEIYTLVGEPDLAMDQLEQLLAVPSQLSAASIKVDPTWAPLRGNPRFQKLIGGDPGR